jgi:hypothetical protein
MGAGLWLLAATLLPTLGSTVDDVVATEMKNHKPWVKRVKPLL